MTAQEKLLERKQLVEDVFAFRPGKRTLMLANFYGWQFFDCGYNLHQALADYTIIEKCTLDMLDRYDFDMWCFSDSSPQRVWKAMGGEHIYINKNGTGLTSNDRSTMLDTEYSEFITNPDLFMWSKIFKRNCREGLTLGELKNVCTEFICNGECAEKIARRTVSDYGALNQAPGFFALPLDAVLNNYRGIRGMALDVRRHNSQLQELMNVLYERNVAPMLQDAETIELGDHVAHYTTQIMAHGFLSRKQIEQLYWPGLKKSIDTIIAQGKRVSIFCENSIDRIADLFQDYPNGSLMLIVEQDDPITLRQKLPNAVICGGMPIELLGYGTPQQCIDRAKKLIDGVGEGFILAANKPLSFPNDCKRENLLALSEFIHSGNY